MTHEELTQAIEELERLVQTGSDYERAGTTARELLTILEATNEAEVTCRALLVLSISLWRRSMATEAQPYAEQARALAEQNASKDLTARAYANAGSVHWWLNDYPRSLEYYGKALALHEELGDKSGIAIVTGNIGLVQWSLSDYPRSLEYYGKALALHEELGDKSGIAAVTGDIGAVYFELSDYSRSLEYYGKALALHEELGDKNGIARVTGNIGLVSEHLNDYPRSLEYYGKSLALHEELGNKRSVAIVTGNIGNVHADLSDYPRSLEYYGKALALYEELADKSGVASVTGNIGIVYKSLSDYPRSLEYYGKALALHEELADKSSIARVTGNIGAVYGKDDFDGYDAERAEECLLKAISMFGQLGSKRELYESHKELSDVYKRQKRWEEFSVHFETFHDIEKEVQNEEAKKKAEQLDLERKTAEREKQLAVERAKHEATEQLLHNVLPPSIAHRMVNGEQLIAEKLESVSVLFADIVGFTQLSANITPEELVAGLDRIFSSFDALAEKHGLEKIKTIGDAYMVVAGAPEQREDHAEAMACFAIEMTTLMKDFHSFTTGAEVQLRIGIHSGEVVAGVIGKKKFSYDLWGDAVNTASRMESHGEAGRIHCSEDFKNTLVETHGSASLRFTERGKMDIKGKGTMKTYFLESLR